MTNQCELEGISKCDSMEGEACDMPEKLLALADEAWNEVMKEKIKTAIQKSCGVKMDKLANLVAETNKAKWAHEIQGKVNCDAYKQSLLALFREDNGK
ncbi:MAG: hypothetical protein HQM08_24370 [Candidatus Riflebacteria bacterium]|nr:hypothetical protein [Candidatus Riflebacteria bacterium]